MASHRTLQGRLPRWPVSRRRWIALASVLLLSVSHLAGALEKQAPAPTLEELHGLDELRGLFNRDPGVPRVVLLLSPT